MKITTEDIIQAQKALTDSQIINGNKYDHVFKGYFSSFGASVAQAGLLPTIIFFESDSDRANERKKVIDALKKMLSADGKDIGGSLAKHIIDNKKANDQDFLQDVTRKMVAMKMALRLYQDKK